MKASRDETPFFVGYLPVPKGLGLFLAVAAIGLVVGFLGGGLLTGAGQDAPEEAAIRFDYGRQTVTGAVMLTPYPILYVTEGTERIPAGRTLMMTAAGKSGVDSRAMGLEDQLTQVQGVALERGTIDMLQLRGGRQGIQAIEGDAPDIPYEDLGRWRLTGEICDGKCLYGAMRPGRGLAHKACANLCLIGDVPPVFVTTAPVAGAQFLLITGPDGTRLPQAAYDFVGQPVAVEGGVERFGDLTVFRLDPATLAAVR